MAKQYTQEQQVERAQRKLAHKAENAKTKQFKHTMEIVRTACSVLAVTLNVFILTHVLGFWGK